ncbi:Uncharacterized protein TPAR_08023, partial [Tolypocladium paradoxum]
MPPLPDLSVYRLPDADSQRIFHSEILPAELPPPDTQPSSSPASSSKPLALLTVGQTGAGKTLLAQTLLGPLRLLRGPASPPPAHLIADTYKTYHP